jgi:hypothetical protein
MGKIQDAYCIGSMGIHKALQPLCSILNGDNLFGLLQSPTPDFHTGSIRKEPNLLQAGEVGVNATASPLQFLLLDGEHLSNDERLNF